MTKTLYEEAIADAKKLREVAEADATNTLLEAVKPRIKRLIESELMGLDDFGGASEPGVDAFDQIITTSDNEDVSSEPPVVKTNPAFQPPRSTSFSGVRSSKEAPVIATAPETDICAVVTDEPVDVKAVPGDNMLDVVTPDTEGKLELNLDDLNASGEEEDDVYELSLESAEKLLAVKNAAAVGVMTETQLLRKIDLCEKTIAYFKALPLYKQAGRSTQRKISKLTETVVNTYGYVQDVLKGVANQELIEQKLEAQFQDLSKLQEQKGTIMKKKLVNEEDLTLKLTGLPDLDDDALENVGVDLVTGDGEEEELAVDDDMGDVDGDEGDDDMDLDFGEDEDMDENQMIEIDESAIVKEIKRMRTLREEFAKPSTAGNKIKPNTAKSFGGGKIEGEPLDADVIDEADESLDELQNRRKKDEKGDEVADGHSSMAESKGRRKNATATNEQAEAQKLRTQLAASNLLNAKLAYTNKLLQLEALSQRQKATVIERLDEAQSLREVKLIYESLTKALARKSAVNESFSRSAGSSSAVLGSSGAKLIEESSQTQRWAQLAGITKKR